MNIIKPRREESISKEKDMLPQAQGEPYGAKVYVVAVKGTPDPLATLR